MSLYTVNNEGVYNIKNERILRILPQLLNLTTSETKEFCEASSIFELFSTEPAGSCHYVLHLFHSICLKSIVPATRKKSEARSYEVLHLPRKIILPDQNATLLSALKRCLWYCACHGTCIFAAPLQNLQASHPCNRFCNCYKTLTLCSLFLKVQNPLRLPQKLTAQLPKALSLRCFQHFDFEMCFAPQRQCTF